MENLLPQIALTHEGVHLQRASSCVHRSWACCAHLAKAAFAQHRDEVEVRGPDQVTAVGQVDVLLDGQLALKVAGDLLLLQRAEGERMGKSKKRQSVVRTGVNFIELLKQKNLPKQKTSTIHRISWHL